VKALAIDGGGIRGLIPALVLAEIERRTGRPMATMVDLIAGTSTGGIIACGLAKPEPLPAEEIAAIYEQDGPEIFDRSALKVITSADGYLDERYDSRGLVTSLRRHLGTARLRDATTRVLMPVYDTEARQALLLRSGADDVSMVDAAHATSAAPTYFEPVRLGPRTLIDGGVFAINPAVFAYAEGADDLLLSLGTGSHTRRLPYDDVKDWGTSSSTAPRTPSTRSSARSPASATSACRRASRRRATTSTTPASPTSPRCAARPSA
jgi:patatin-like phospholipase/acyl hydrolase